MNMNKLAAKTETALTRTVLKKSGGSLIMTVPAAARKALHLVEGQEMTVAVEGERLVLAAARPARRRPKYTLKQLLAECNPDAPLTEEEKAWLNMPPVGRELW
jgi:antitoxin ChpS